MHSLVSFPFLAFCLLQCCLNLTTAKKKGVSISENTDKQVPLKWATFLLYGGCFELTGTPEKEKNIPQNDNYICHDFCGDQEKKYSATIGERCLCFSSLPTARLSTDKCDSACSQGDADEGQEGSSSSGCKGLECCGSVANNAVTVVQAVKPTLKDQTTRNNDEPPHTHGTKSRDGFGNFIVHEGCFKRAGNPAKERNDAQNVNVACINFCVEENLTYAATISDRCLCYSSLPSERLQDKKCSAPCPGYGYDEGTPCEGFGCCGSVDDDGVSVYQSVPSK